MWIAVKSTVSCWRSRSRLFCRTRRTKSASSQRRWNCRSHWRTMTHRRTSVSRAPSSTTAPVTMNTPDETVLTDTSLKFSCQNENCIFERAQCKTDLYQVAGRQSSGTCTQGLKTHGEVDWPLVGLSTETWVRQGLDPHPGCQKNNWVDKSPADLALVAVFLSWTHFPTR